MKKKAIIISIKGFRLTNREKLLFLNENPWGLILFTRNIKSLRQIETLIKNVKKYAAVRAELKALIKNPDTSYDDREAAVAKLDNLPKSSSRIRIRNRCFKSN